MKVTVCFGNVRVVVPCGHGDILVRDLVREAILRYKKASGKGSDTWVAVHNLQSQGGGILDLDDRLSDVVDDREQILANFEDGDGAHHTGGDGASGSSVGTDSPDIFHDGEHKYGPNYPRTDIEVTGEQIASGIPGALQVRRGSEPALNQLPVGPPVPSEHTKRWSAAPLILEPPSYNNNGSNNNNGKASSKWSEDSREDDEEDDEGGHFGRIGRDGSSRLSMQFLGDAGGYRWAEAAEKAAFARPSTSLPREGKRKEPLGQANVSPTSPLPPDLSLSAQLVIIRNEPGPLGIHVVPDYDHLGKDRGLLVQGIEPLGRIDRDGRLAIYDRIIEINGQNLLNMPFQRVQEMFKLSLTSPELRLKVIKSNNPLLDSLRKPPPPIYPKFPEDKENVSMVECEQKQSTNTKVATVSPTKKMPPVTKMPKSLLIANTRKIGRKYEIDLVKGPHGLGFSITTRDNPAGGNCPIYIKNIIPKGAAVEDGRLKIGDRLLEVNGVEMTGKGQAEAVAILRNVPPGGKVRIVVSRQEDVLENAGSLPRIIDTEHESEREVGLLQNDKVTVNNHHGSVIVNKDHPPIIPPLPQSHLMQSRGVERSTSVAKIISQFQEAATVTSPTEKYDEAMIFPWKHREILTLNIPVHDSEKAGLGISVKGKTSGHQDLGIFIKSVIHGGAASRDKRLRTNDQLLNVNGISLLRQSNSDAMETLRKAMTQTEGPVPEHITLTIARRAPSPGGSGNRSFSSSSRGSDPNLLSSSGELFSNHSRSSSSNENNDASHSQSHNSNSGTSASSANTVIFNPAMDCSGGGGSMNKSGQMQTWNPVLDRLTGSKQQQLRNESYYKATHDTWSSSMIAQNLTSTTLNLTTAEPVMIEHEDGSRIQIQQNLSRINVHMTNGLNGGSSTELLESRKDHEPDGKATSSTSTTISRTSDSQSKILPPGSDATNASQLSLENLQGFSRDAFGRQSMSEKRHATLDAKSTDTYQRSKKLREERKTNLVRVGSVESVISVNRSSDHPEYADKLGQLGPSLGMKKSSSLESLQTMVQEIQMQEEGDPAYSYRGPSGALKVIRGRGCEESFRAAVDKHIATDDPNHQSEVGAKKHWLLDGPLDEREIDGGFNNSRGGPRQSSLNAALDGKHHNKASGQVGGPGKKKPGLLKGIGSMFRFGKHRKLEFSNVDPNAQHYHQVGGEFNVPNNNNNNHQDVVTAGDERQSEQQPPQPQKQHHPQQQQQQQQHPHSQQPREPIYQRHGFIHRHAEQVQVIPENSIMPPPPVKYRSQDSEHGHQRRVDRKMNDRLRHTYYHTDERDVVYDHQRSHPQSSNNNIYGEYGGRPGSRSGITDSVPFTHYVNYNELQTHLRSKDPLSDSQIVQMRLQVQQQRLKVEEESRKQHQYHSQRQARPESNQLRPVSNFYEYESVQSVLNNRGGRMNGPMPPQPPPGYQYQQHQQPSDINSNSLTRHPGQPVQGRHSRNQPQQKGPFVTQVTIGDSHNTQNGTKV